MNAAEPTIGQPIIRLGQTESTNDVARELARAGVTEGAVVVAEHQTRGRGRDGRTWASPVGGLWCSVVLRPEDGTALGLLSLAVGVAVGEAVQVAAGVETGLKWPNDVVVGDRKLAGVLLETVGRAVVAGIGINVAVERFDGDLARRAVSLHTLAAGPVTRDAVLDALLERLARWYGVWRTDRSRILDAWRPRDTTAGRRVVVRVAGRSLEGIAEGIDDDGALRLRLPDGRAERVLAGSLESGVSAAPGV
ncbi:MAG: biotin--[acetyl-CoA-carboxylase] ligase [Armatimonadota bacterium]|nr:biotin--[acetyl-CoA-carboxylase] ligase [Armatimonadota bacterium]